MSTNAPRADVVIGVDMGTTSTKAVAFTADGTLVAFASAGYPLDEPLPGHVEQDPQLILAAVHQTIRSVVDELGAHRIAGLSFSSAMHSLMALDQAHTPLTAAITWADTRASVQAERLRASPTGLALHRRTGTPIHPMSPLLKLMWFAEQALPLCQQVRTWAGIKDWVLWQLCGELVIDLSLASCSGLLDIHTRQWDPEALALAGITPAQLPRLVSTTHVLPALTEAAAAATGLPRHTAVVVGAGDGPLANLGVGAVRPGVAACSIGTSGALRVTVDKPAVDPRGGVFCYALTDERWVIGGAINNGGVTLDWVRAEIAGGPAVTTQALLDQGATVPVGSGGLIMLPYLLSERAPHWSSLARGAYVGLTRAHGSAHLTRAAVEGVCLQLALVLQSMQAAGLQIHEIRATGGTTRHALWQQILADTSGLPIGLPEGQEGSGYGAALLGMQALGLIESIDVAAEHIRVDTTVQPQPEHAATYRALREIYEGLYDALVPTFERLRELAPSLPLAAS